MKINEYGEGVWVSRYMDDSEDSEIEATPIPLPEWICVATNAPVMRGYNLKSILLETETKKVWYIEQCTISWRKYQEVIATEAETKETEDIENLKKKYGFLVDPGVVKATTPIQEIIAQRAQSFNTAPTVGVVE